MMRFSVRVCALAVVLAAAPALAGEAFHCRTCAPGYGGMAYGNTGCGPRYCGEKHEPSCPDPCDACNRWRSCNGVTQGPDMLTPWQQPPGRGFMTAEQVGYDTRPACQLGEYQFRVR
ncbi:MAG: hypothetical protein ACKOHG_12110 [Planctomycetia bacterium]